MFRTLLATIGVVELLAPDAFVTAAERIALENPADCECESRVVPIARVEGLLISFLTVRSDRSYATLKRFLGVIGLLALVFPRRFVEYEAELAYVDADRCRWRSWVYPATRLVGVLYLLVAIEKLRSPRYESERTPPVSTSRRRCGPAFHTWNSSSTSTATTSSAS